MVQFSCLDHFFLWEHLCLALTEMTHKPCRMKLHSFTVCYLFRPPSLFTLSPGSCSLTAERLAVIQKASAPIRQKQMRAFLCMTGFYEQRIPSFLVLPESLEQNVHSTILTPPPLLPASETLASMSYLIQVQLKVSPATMEILTFTAEVNYTQKQVSLCPLSLHIWFCFQFLCSNLSPFKKQCFPWSCWESDCRIENPANYFLQNDSLGKDADVWRHFNHALNPANLLPFLLKKMAFPTAIKINL